MQISNSCLSNPNFTAIRIVTATPREIENFSNNFKNFTKRNFMFKTNIDSESQFVVITGIDRLKYLFKNIKESFSGHSYSSEARRAYMKSRIPYSEIVSKYEKDFNIDKLASFKKFLQNNNAKHVSVDEFVQEVKTNKI